jgi:hypothetical protein
MGRKWPAAHAAYMSKLLPEEDPGDLVLAKKGNAAAEFFIA